MIRTVLGFAVLAVVGIIALKLILALLGIAFKLLWAILWLAFLGFLFYLVLKAISPDTARRVRDALRGRPGM